MCKMGGGSTGAADQARADENARQARVSEAIGRVNEVFGQFGEPFFQARQQAFQDYAIPQLGRQFEDARRDLAFRLADQGITRSSAAAKSMADLEREYALNRQSIVDQAAGYANQARSDIEGARGNLIGMAQSTGDSAAVGNSAINQAASIAAQPSFSPLGQMFQNVGAAAGAVRRQRLADDIRSSAGGGVKLFGNTSGSGRVVSAA